MPRYALVIGISQYQNPLKDLSKPATDAEVVANFLKKKGDFEDITLLKGQVTGEKLGKAFQRLLLEQAIKKEALIYFTGHGIPVSDSLGEQAAYLATSDCAIATEGNKIIAQKGGIAFASLNNLIRKADLSSLVVLLDCCHSGDFLERYLVEQTFTAFNSQKDYYLITACRGFQEAYAMKSQQHSIFTGAMLNGLSDEKAGDDGRVSGDRLFDFITSELKGSGQEPIRMGWGRSITLVQYLPKQKVQVVKEDCPYQGLRYFGEKQKEFFFGREKVIQLLWQKLGEANFVPIIGASGSGKSSVVRAGLIPKLKENGWELLAEPIWPGVEPLAELKRAFNGWFDRSQLPEIYSLIENGDLAAVIERLPGSKRLLLVVDQFEEVFTLRSLDKDERTQRFIELLTKVAEIPDSGLAIVTTMRADFLEYYLSYESLTKQFNQDQAVYMPPLLGAELEEAIVKPANLQGYHLETGLQGAIFDDVGKEKDCLPLLQFALTELWEKRDNQKHQLTLEQYQALGGVTGALNRHAEKVYSYKDFQKDLPQKERTAEEQEWIKRIFLRLVRTGEGEKDTRQRQPKAKLLSIAKDNLADEKVVINDVLDQLICGRLLVSGEEGVDLAHETLIEGWQRFVEWRQENREMRRLIDRIEDAFQEWEKQQTDDNLMTRSLLSKVQERWSEIELTLSPLVQHFYHQSYAYEQERNKALQQVTESTIRQSTDRIVILLDSQPLQALVLAIQTIGMSLDRQLQGKLFSRFQASFNLATEKAREEKLFIDKQEPILNIFLTLDAQYIVSYSTDGIMRLWNLQGSLINQYLIDDNRQINCVAFSPDGQWIAGGKLNGNIGLWNLKNNLDYKMLQGHEAKVNSITFSPDSQFIISGSDDGTIRLWNIEGDLIGNFSSKRGRHNFITSVSFSPDGQYIASGGSDKKVRFWNLQGKPIFKVLQGHKDTINYITFSSDGQYILTSSADQNLRLWKYQENLLLKEDAISASAVAFKPDSQQLIIGDKDGNIKLLLFKKNLTKSQSLYGHQDEVTSVNITSDSQYLVSSSRDGTIRFWNLADRALSGPFRQHKDAITSITCSPKGSYFITSSNDGTIRLWDFQGNSTNKIIPGNRDAIISAIFRSDQQSIVSCSKDGSIRVCNLQGELINNGFINLVAESEKFLILSKSFITSVAFSPDENLVVSGSQDGRIQIWDIKGNRIDINFQSNESSITSIAFSLDGKLIVAGREDGSIWLWDTQGNLISKAFRGHERCVTSISFKPDNRVILSGSNDKTLRLWDIRDTLIGEPIKGHEEGVTSVSFSPDGQYIVSGSMDKTVRIWDFQGNPINDFPREHESSVTAVAFSRNGNYVISGCQDGSITLWRTGWKAWLQLACDQLRYHPIFKNPQTKVEKAACEVCQKYVWSKNNPVQ